MKAGLIITGAGATLALTSCPSFDDPDFIDALREKGISKYIVFDVPVDVVRDQYGQLYHTALADLKQSDVLRVIDVDGQRIFKKIPFEAFGQLTSHEEPAIRRRAA